MAERLRRPGTAALSDAMGKGGAMHHDMQCRSAQASMAGPAFTVRVHSADLLMVAPALKQCPKDHVLVIDGHGDLNTALWGELTTYSAQGKGLAGVVIDGALRDARAVARCEFPVFARAVVPNAGGAEYLGEINGTVSCAGQVVRPGDWIVGDEDGVVVIPAESTEFAVATAERIIEAEKDIELAIRHGAELADLIGAQGVIEQKRAGVFIPQLRRSGP
jgi:3-hexulose-6-phosphate synthase/6-phospho-3-hexuloisomerase